MHKLLVVELAEVEFALALDVQMDFDFDLYPGLAFVGLDISYIVGLDVLDIAASFARANNMASLLRYRYRLRIRCDRCHM